MSFKATKYTLLCCSTGHRFEDSGWTLADPECNCPSLVRAEYESRKFNPRTDLDGFYRYADWLPIKRTLEKSCPPVTYKSEALASHLGLNNLYVTFSGYFPKIGAGMETCSFKETEAYSVCARLPENNDKIMVVASAGNTARAFAKVCSDNNIPLLISIPEDNINALWFTRPLNDCVKIIASPKGSDYFDAIALGDAVCRCDRFFAEGGAKNIARRDGMGTTLFVCRGNHRKDSGLIFPGYRKRYRNYRSMGGQYEIYRRRPFRQPPDEAYPITKHSFHPYV